MMTGTDEQSGRNALVLVTGPSGAGRATAIKVLEDFGFESIDNLPLSLLPRLLDGSPIDRPLALGLDVRNRDFRVNALLDVIHRLAENATVSAEVLYLDCSKEVLSRRFSETRRRHPLAPEDAPSDGIEAEIALLEPIRQQATTLIDTSELTPHDLRDALREWYDPSNEGLMAISIQSFSYKRGVPRGVDMVFDCRFLKNPHWQPELRARDGRDGEVRAHVEGDPLCAPFFDNVASLIEMLLPAYQAEGKSHLTIGFGCTGGQHRSVVMAEKLANQLALVGWQASKRHRELERHVRSVPPWRGGTS